MLTRKGKTGTARKKSATDTVKARPKALQDDGRQDILVEQRVQQMQKLSSHPQKAAFVDGQTIPGLEQVLKHLGVHDPWMQTAWMLNGNSRLSGRFPLDVLREGNLEAVLDAAQIYGEQGAA